ncbi:NAD(P)H-dependent oxidoreductase [Halomonas urumqiensis]|uniref:Dehydrogenase n=1 Tax=Halomonas urumqiensis TaxID=1684789 RepID=A0A2N7UJ54_9GAMM|nr:NAD(P)H-dependent oxidoreductase [Halomonas urumqiensis]PMR80477.1 dehydrogenase [Halomonas urumqiensis]PTB01678.1 flavodoxin family protein [Halomonas urumqiensis]GHE22234.1 dehydrogenase [Halomonas urumqiensis]
MSQRILILQGHPDASEAHLCHALADHYREGANAQGHEVRFIDLASLEFPLLHSQKEWQAGPLPTSLTAAQEAIGWCQHLVLFFPLWLGDMPALVKAFLEQVLRPGFAFEYVEGNPLGKKGLKGRSARVVVTMGMPAAIYRHLYRAHSVKSLERNILGFVGLSPVRETLVGSVEAMSEKKRNEWFHKLHELGAKAK